ncbi:hypothetical protein V8C86DRAFT_879252 [Haematococcus lacustris]
MAQPAYLETFVEGTYFIPTELSRILNNIKVLDDRCNQLSESLESSTAQLLNVPPQYQQPLEEVHVDIMLKMQTEQQMLSQLAEEKVQYAQQAYDMLEMHAIELERTIENFITDTGILDHTGPNHKRRSHTSQLLAPGGPPGGPGSGLPGSGLHLYGGQQLVAGPTQDALLPGGGFKRPPPAAMPASSVQPTVPGCILTAADINLALVGRHAELYWPDDALWYLIEIQGVDLVSRMANIMYHSGEVEDLNLAEIVADRHMSLIPLDYYARRFGAP